MINLAMTSIWNVCTPTLFRYLESNYVEAFFSDGSLRLSSFASFKQHEDEQRLDKTEGETSLSVRTQQPEPRLLFSRGSYGLNAYVLSTTMMHSEELKKAFNRDSYIRINDSTEFAIRIARHVPSLTTGFEGPCLYQTRKVINRSIDHMDTTQFHDQSDPSKPNRELLEKFTREQMAHYPFFLKHKFYSHQVEYRLLWMTSAPADGFIDIKVPEAIAFCSRPTELTE